MTQVEFDALSNDTWSMHCCAWVLVDTLFLFGDPPLTVN